MFMTKGAYLASIFAYKPICLDILPGEETFSRVGNIGDLYRKLWKFLLLEIVAAIRIARAA